MSIGIVLLEPEQLQGQLKAHPESRPSDVLVLHETSFKEYFGHTYYKELEKMAEKYPVLAYHCDHREAPEDCRLKFAAAFF